MKVMAQAALGLTGTAGESRGPGFAPALAHQRDLLLRVGPALADHLEPSVASLVRDLVERIRQRPIRLAVIGQMKAGKSSFLNALADRPGLLPTDVNPWTAVVTQLHFGHPSGRTDGAVFRFFSEEEWQQLSEGGNLRILQQKLVPELDLDVLRSQLSQIRMRARARLGDGYQALLGTQHHFASLPTGMLARYVADAESDGPIAAETVYSDITRSADLFLDAMPFGLPLTLVDTPGTNDPFLVRDEITLRCLDEMDAAIVVLSARQAFSTADLALVRTMRGLRKDRLLVVVNRCDELDDPPTHGKLIAAHVSRQLEREFGQEVPVIAMSALWANVAARSDPAAIRETLTDRLARQAMAAGVATRDEIETWRHNPTQMPIGRVAEILRTASGLPNVIDALVRLVADSSVGQLLAQALTTLVTISEQQAAVARRDLQHLEDTVKSAHTDVLSGGFELQRLQSAVERLDGTMAKLERIAADRTAEIGAAQRQGLDRLREHLHKVVAAFIEQERATVTFSLDQQTTTKPARYDVSKLRKELEQAFLGEYRTLYQHIVNIQLAASQHFRRIVNDELPSTNLDVHVNVISNSFSYPSLSALSRVSAFDVDPKLWARWRRSKRSLKEAVDAFEAILRAEFLAIADELTGLAEREIMGSASSLQRRLNLTIMDAVHSARQRRADLLQSMEAAEAKNEPLVRERMLEAQLDRLTEARERLRRVDGLARTLKAAAPQAMDETAYASVG